MTPEDRAKLDNLYELVRENNELLHSLRRRNRIATGLKIFYWVLIIGISFGAFYFIQPYIDFIRNVGTPSTTNQTFTEQVRALLE